MEFPSSRVALVVEDEPILLLEVVERLEEIGVCALEALGHERAMEYIEAAERLDLVITDIRLGGPTDGWEIASSARLRHPEVKVIYLSANDPIEERMVEGAEFLGKPCDWTVLMERVRAAFES